jgi:hypothetical protein
VGGLNNLWERGLKQNHLCGCGVPFRDCPFWASVGREAFGGWETLDVDEILDLKRAVARYRHIPLLVAPRLRRRFLGKLDAYSSYLANVYQAITRVSGCRYVVDNSHDMAPALLVRKTPGLHSRVLHLVRDSRGFAFSVSKRVLRAEATTAPAYMTRYSPVRASGEWMIANLPYHTVKISSPPQLRVKYESLVAAPNDEIARIAEFLGLTLKPSQRSVVDGDLVEIGANHMVSGNPHRLGRKEIHLRLDEEWRTKMRRRDRIVVTVLTSPLTLAYGYLQAPRPWERRIGSRAQPA